MERRRFIVAYDIRDPGRLRQIHKIAKEFGEPMQYSVFVCDLDGVEQVRMRTALLDVMNQAVDSIVFMDLGLANTPHAPLEFLGSRRRLPSQGARII